MFHGTAGDLIDALQKARATIGFHQAAIAKAHETEKAICHDLADVLLAIPQGCLIANGVCAQLSGPDDDDIELLPVAWGNDVRLPLSHTPEDCGGDSAEHDPVLDSVKLNGDPSERELARAGITNILDPRD